MRPFHMRASLPAFAAGGGGFALNRPNGRCTRAIAEHQLLVRWPCPAATAVQAQGHPQGSSARGWPSGPPAHTNLLCSLSFGDSTNSRPSSSPPPPTRRLRPAGHRPASRRLSRSPSTPERTIHVLHRRRWGRTPAAVLSGAEAARRSHKRLAGRRPSSATLRLFLPGRSRNLLYFESSVPRQI